MWRENSFVLATAPLQVKFKYSRIQPCCTTREKLPPKLPSPAMLLQARWL